MLPSPARWTPGDGTSLAPSRFAEPVAPVASVFSDMTLEYPALGIVG